MEQRLWYESGTDDWMEGLPVGNGRLAAMVFGTQADRIALNHEWLWRGVHRERDNAPVPEGALAHVRELLTRGDFFRATALANTYFGGMGGMSEIKSRVDAYQPAGELTFRPEGLGAVTKRELRLDTGVCRVERGGLTAEVFADLASTKIVCRWTADKPFSGVLAYGRTEDADAVESCEYAAGSIRYRCVFSGGVRFVVIVHVVTDGSAVPGDDGLSVTAASQLTAYADICVDGEKAELAPEADYASLRAAHETLFAEEIGRFRLDVSLPVMDAPTDERVRRVREGGEDGALLLLYYNYGRYLLVSSSARGELPANLQGKWNAEIAPPWESDYHFDINLQMNYWAAEATGLSGSAESLIKYVMRMIPHAKKAARDLYGCRGVVFPLQADAWGRSTSESFGWAVWIGAAPWIARHVWDRWRYGGDRRFLAEQAYPFFREIALFYEDYLVKDAHGVYQIMPSQSPENRFAGTGMFPVSIGISSAMDVQLAYDALGYAVSAAEELGCDEGYAARWKQLRNALPPFKTGADGRLLEWEAEREEVEPGHRHVSHLYGLYPSDLFNQEERPEQFTAAAKSLAGRLSHGGGHTGWSRAWVACLYARLADGAAVEEHISALVRDFSTVSLLDLHPPRIFQIDGNLGAVAALTEGVAQFWNGKLHLLRALPPSWQSGEVAGLKTPGGHTVDFRWENGRVVSCRVTIGFGGRLVISANREQVVGGKAGEIVEVAL